jgi:hypothetical protein
MDNRRTEIARDYDDSDIIDNAEPAPSQGGSSGGNLQEDIATEAELERVRDPEAHRGIAKQDKIDHQQETSNNLPADKQPGGDGSPE